MSPQQVTAKQPDLAPSNDRIVVFGGSVRTLDLLRLATIRSEDIVVVGTTLDAAVLRFAGRFGIETRRRPPHEADIGGASALLLAVGDVDDENRLVRSARGRGVPVHVAGRALMSDFDLIEFLEQRPHTSIAS